MVRNNLMSGKIKSAFFALIILSFSVVVIGCGSVPKVDNIVNDDYTPEEGYDKYKIVITQITSDKNYSLMSYYKYGLSKEAFKNAVERKIKNLGFYQGLTDFHGFGGEFNLLIDIISEEIPKLGTELYVGFKVRYRLIDVNNDTVLYDKTVVSGGVATFSDALFANKRLIIALERSAASNINEFARDLKKVMKDILKMEN